MGKFEGPTFDVKQVAKYLNISEITVYRLTAKGEIPAKKVGAQWRFVKAEVDRWLISRV